jgi:hypothetical protein
VNWGAYEGARACTGSPTSGARALLAWLQENYEGYSLGIYNCRTVRGGSTTSLHGEGRAIDWGLRYVNGSANPIGTRILQHIGAHGDRLGLQATIWNRRIYSRVSPNGRAYNGVSPHTDHLHIELNWAGARNLTLATCRAVLSGAVTTQAVTTPTPLPQEDDMLLLRYKDQFYQWYGGRLVHIPWDHRHLISYLEKKYGVTVQEVTSRAVMLNFAGLDGNAGGVYIP